MSLLLVGELALMLVGRGLCLLECRLEAVAFLAGALLLRAQPGDRLFEPVRVAQQALALGGGGGLGLGEGGLELLELGA